MELVYCSACEAFSTPGATVCQKCGAAISDEPALFSGPLLVANPIEEPPAPEEPPVPEVPALPPFEGAPEVVAKVSALEAAIDTDPSLKTPYLQLSQVYAEAKRRDLAAAVLERFLEVDPNNAYVRHRLTQVTAAQAAAAPGTPEKTPAPRSAAAPRPAPALMPTSPRHTVAPVGLAQRPAPPVIRREFQKWTGRQKAMIAGGLAGVALLVAVRVFVFPATRLLVSGDFKAFAPAFSSTGKHLAFLIADAKSTQLAVYDISKGSYRAVAPVASESFSWSPDGARLAYSGSSDGEDWRGSLHVFDVNTNQARKVAAGDAPVWSGSSTLITTCSPEPRSAVGDDDEPSSYSASESGPRFCRVDVATGSAQRTSLAPDYRMAVSGSVDSVVYEQIKDDPSQAASGESPGKEFEKFVDRVAAGGALNVIEGTRDLSRELEAKKYEDRRRELGKKERLPYESDIVVASLDGGSPSVLTSGGQSGFPSWTADGRILYATNAPAGIEIWSMTALGSDKKSVLSGVKLVDPTAVKLSADGRQVFFVAPVEGDSGIARAMTGEDPADIHVAPAGGGAPRRLSNKHPFKQRFAVSADGKLVAYEVGQDIKLIGGAQRSEIWLLRR